MAPAVVGAGDDGARAGAAGAPAAVGPGPRGAADRRAGGAAPRNGAPGGQTLPGGGVRGTRRPAPAGAPPDTDGARSRSGGRTGGVDALTREAAAGARDLSHLDECGFAPTLPTTYTWARVGVRPLVPYEAVS